MEKERKKAMARVESCDLCIPFIVHGGRFDDDEAKMSSDDDKDTKSHFGCFM
jgi:hypothetical protein